MQHIYDTMGWHNRDARTVVHLIIVIYSNFWGFPNESTLFYMYDGLYAMIGKRNTFLPVSLGKSGE